MKFFKDWAYWRNQVKIAGGEADNAKIESIKSKEELLKFKREHSSTLGQKTKLENDRVKFKEEKEKFYNKLETQFYEMSKNPHRFLEKFSKHSDFTKRGATVGNILFWAKDKLTKEEIASLQLFAQMESVIYRANAADKLHEEIRELKQKNENLGNDLADVKLLMRQVAQDPATDRLIKKLKRTVTP